MYVTLEQIKKHLNIDLSFTDDDMYLLSLAAVAEKVVQRALCVVLADLLDDDGQLPMPIIQAMLFYIGTLYNSRENVAFGGNPVETPYTFQFLLDLYKNYADTTSTDFQMSVLDEIAKDTYLSNEVVTAGDVMINNNENSPMTMTQKAIKRIKDTATINDNGNMTVKIETI